VDIVERRRSFVGLYIRSDYEIHYLGGLVRKDCSVIRTSRFETLISGPCRYQTHLGSTTTDPKGRLSAAVPFSTAKRYPKLVAINSASI
jgi:hypothetical protein